LLGCKKHIDYFFTYSYFEIWVLWETPKIKIHLITKFFFCSYVCEYHSSRYHLLDAYSSLCQTFTSSFVLSIYHCVAIRRFAIGWKFLQKGVFKNYGMSSSTPEMSLLKIMVWAARPRTRKQHLKSNLVNFIRKKI
jgi:hypothetical protein